jgi:hypothetical protein
MQGVGMDQLREFLKLIDAQGLAKGNFLGLLHLLIGRTIRLHDGTVVSTGLTWREAAALLKRVRWDKECVTELGLEPASLSPRDRERYWNQAISQAKVSSAAAAEAGDRLAQAVQAHGYEVGPAPKREG